MKEMDVLPFKKELDATLTSEGQERNILTCYHNDTYISTLSAKEFAEIFKNGLVTWFTIKKGSQFIYFDRKMTKKLYEDIFAS